MDKVGILQEKVAAATLPKGNTCQNITDDDVFTDSSPWVPPRLSIHPLWWVVRTVARVIRTRCLSAIAVLINPRNENVKPFYIHTKHCTDTNLEEIKSYIGEVFVAEGWTRQETRSNMVKYGVDGFVDYD